MKVIYADTRQLVPNASVLPTYPANPKLRITSKSTQGNGEAAIFDSLPPGKCTVFATVEEVSRGTEEFELKAGELAVKTIEIPRTPGEEPEQDFLHVKQPLKDITIDPKTYKVGS